MKSGNIVRGEFPEGCKLCVKGAKLVFFATGLCDRGCWYCPISKVRRGRDVVYANERPVRTLEDVLEEAERMGAEGASVTGGDPTKVPDRVRRVVMALKKEFGPDFHVHVYVPAESAEERVLKELVRAGVNEVRVHPSFDPSTDKAAARTLASLDADVGFEAPAIPGEEAVLERVILLADEAGLDFVNVNELEFTESNRDELLKRGFQRVDDDLSDAVKGSIECAMKVFENVSDKVDISLNFCPSSVKDSVQFRNRLKRTALNVAEPYEVVDEDDGLLVRGVIEVVDGRPEDVARVFTELLEVPEEYIEIDESRLYVHPLVLTDVADEGLLEDVMEASGCRFRAYLERKFPTWRGAVVEKIDLG